ncbi:hypothetical protein [Desulfuromonas acetoxidans]|uniref:hypothetical protein n=1 Tax=Desulfuromonas acetoxidans TaxID=891 RepID=UPI00292FF959|nr:hypothetical protein [Desulfuromonas acetoxidans]
MLTCLIGATEADPLPGDPVSGGVIWFLHTFERSVKSMSAAGAEPGSLDLTP